MYVRAFRSSSSLAALIAASCLVVASGAIAAETAKSGADELNLMRAALERNPQLEVLATDMQKRLFTVRDKRSGAVQVVALADLAAAPVSHFGDSTGDTPRAASSPPANAASANNSVGAESNTSTQPNYTIERSGGQLRVSGPGVSIVSAGDAGGESSTASRRASDPIICEGRRMLHFDNRDIYVEGDAIVVRDGCEMFITNSRIVATGAGVTVQDGVVHVSNSHIEGGDASFVAGPDARMFVRGSTFNGVSRRDEFAVVQDQGGNRWR